MLIITIIELVVLLVFLIFFHKKLLNKLGLSDRDDKLMFIGYAICLIFHSVQKIIVALTIGQFVYSELILILLFSYLIRSNYKRL